MDNRELFEQNSQRMENAVRGVIPDRVPVYSLVDNYAYEYVGIDSYEASENLEKMYAAYKKTNTDIPFDSVFSVATAKCMKYNDILDGGVYQFVNGIMEINTTCITSMSAEEYPELIASPIEFIANKVALRKFNAFKGVSEESAYQTLCKAIDVDNYQRAFSKKVEKAFEEETGIPISREGTYFHPLDLIFDYFRNIDGTLLDMRRHKEELLDAIAVLDDITFKMLTAPRPDHQIGKSIFNPMHTPPFINKKNFETFYAPTYFKVVNTVKEKGFALMSYFERNYAHLYDVLKDLPKDVIIGLFENDDLSVVKKELGDTICIAGGMKTFTLGNGTKDECIDMAKDVIDTLAPNGKYIFTTDKILYGLSDANPENYRAVNEFVKEYAKY